MRRACVMVAALLAASPAVAQIDSREGIALQNQILELRQQLQSLQQRGGGAPAYRERSSQGSGDPGLTAQLLDRVATLEDQVRQLRGQVDQLTNDQQRQVADFNKQIGDLTFALQNSTPIARPAAPSQSSYPGQPSYLSPPPSVLGSTGAPVLAPSQAPAQPLTPAAPVPRTPELALQEAYAALARHDYPAAIAAAREVIAKRSPRASDAQFVLAQAEMGQHNYQQAAPDFYDAYSRSHSGPRAPDALLGVANALIALNDKQSACEALAKLRVEFPQPRPDVADGESDARRRAACR